MSIRIRKHADKSGPEPARNVRDEYGELLRPELAEGALLAPYPLSHVTIEGTPPTSHRFAEKFVTRALGEGWLSLDSGSIVIHAEPEPVVYHIVSAPGAYCSGCAERLADGPARTVEESRRRLAHVEACDEVTADTLEREPAGYEIRHYWLTQLAGEAA